MKLKSILILVLLTLVASTAFAQKGQKRTVIIKDGKVVTDDISGDLEIPGLGELLGGKRAFLGVSLVDLTPELREHYGADKDAGILVGSIEDGGPADKAGVKVGDILVGIDGKEMTSSFQIRKALRDKKDGDTVRVEVLRGRSRQTLVATVVERDFPNVIRLRDLGGDFEFLPGAELRGRVGSLPNCVELQSKLKELEAKMKELEKKLQK